MHDICMIELIPQCVKCGSPVTDLVEPEVEKQGQLKPGHYIDNKWMCNDCMQSTSENTDENRESNNINKENGKKTSTKL
jgi:hypothetical protein